MDFTKLEGFKQIYYLILMIVFFALMWYLVKSAQGSLKRTGGKWSSVIDEVVIGILVLAGFVIIAQIEPSTILNFLVKPLTWIWDLLLKALRFVGIQV